MRFTVGVFLAIVFFVQVPVAPARAGELAAAVSDDLAKKIEAAVPDKPTVKPPQARKVLVIGRNDSDQAVAAAKMLEIMAKKTGAFAVTFTDGAELQAENFDPQQGLKDYDAFIVNNLAGYDPFVGPKQEGLRGWLREYMGSYGRGLVGLRTVVWPDWKDYGDTIGASRQDTPWKGKEPVTIKLDDPTHTVNAAFGGKPLEIADEIYQFAEPYSRKSLHVLLSLDTDKSPKAGTRADNDYAVSWVRSFGYGGRVFYTCLGHNNETYTNPAVVRHILDGIQFAIGDLPGETVSTTNLELLKKSIPAKATAKPLAKRKLLIYGYPPAGQHEMGVRGVLLSVELAGKQTGAWETEISADGAMLTPEKLKAFDAVVLNNCGNGIPNCDREIAQKVLMDYVRGGKGLMGIHTTAVFLGWNNKEIGGTETDKAFREMLGACFASHPFATPATLHVEDPNGSLSGAFGGKPSWRIQFTDEIYSFREPYSRDQLRVLLSVDTAGLPAIDPKALRPDGDYAIAWVKSYGAGRVFYSALGHDIFTYTDAQYLQFLADAAQFVLGDLKADTKPVPMRGK